MMMMVMVIMIMTMIMIMILMMIMMMVITLSGLVKNPVAVDCLHACAKYDLAKLRFKICAYRVERAKFFLSTKLTSQKLIR